MLMIHRFCANILCAAFAVISLMASFSIVYQNLYIHPFIIVIVFSLLLGITFLVYRNINGNFLVFVNTENINWGFVAFFLCLVGLVIRVSFIFSYPIFQFSDALSYWYLAQSMAEHGAYLPHPDYSGGPFAYRPPGLPIVLSIPMFWFGPEAWIGPSLNLMIYVATCLVIFKTTSKLAGDPWATLAVGLLAVLPANIAVGSLTLTEPLTALLLISGFWATLNLERWSAAILAGFFFGIAALTRPTFLLLGPILLAFLISYFFGNKGNGKKTFIPIVIFVLTLTPWTVRNYIEFGEFVPGSTMGG